MTHKRPTIALALALMVCLAGCGSFLGDQTPTAQSTAQTTDGDPTLTPPADSQSATETTNGDRVGVADAALFSQSFTPSSYLPYSADLAVDGYLRTDEQSTPGMPKSASRTFKRTESATEPGPSELQVMISLRQSNDSASAWITDQTDSLRSNGSEITHQSMSGQPLTIATQSGSGMAETVVLSRVGNAVVTVRAESSDSSTQQFSRDTLAVVLTKLCCG